MEKKHWMIIGIILIIAIIWYVLNKNKESSFGRGGGGRHGGGHGGFHHGGRGGWGGGWGGYWGGYPYPYYDDEPIIVVNSGNCPEGWIWMGAMLGCQKPQGM